eukprot:4428379-Alexandrium_andersonii.AAC.1
MGNSVSFPNRQVRASESLCEVQGARAPGTEAFGLRLCRFRATDRAASLVEPAGAAARSGRVWGERIRHFGRR